jgi:hypothetical protein
MDRFSSCVAPVYSARSCGPSLCCTEVGLTRAAGVPDVANPVAIPVEHARRRHGRSVPRILYSGPVVAQVVAPNPDVHPGFIFIQCVCSL